MKKVLLSSAALCGLVLAAGQAQAADGLKLDLGGYFKGYGAYVDQDEATNTDVKSFDILRSTELHFTGETTLDNGLTVGFHSETQADNNESLDVQESYAYFTGAWGRVNFGAENGAAYLLQVEAPSADSNVDGIRQFIDGVNYSAAPGSLGTFFTAGVAAAQLSNGANGANGGGDDIVLDTTIDLEGQGDGSSIDAFSFDYDDDVTGYANKLTYLSPIFAGFQAGVSYTPNNDDDISRDDTTGVSLDDQTGGIYGDSYELGLRYEGQFDGFGVIAGAGYTHSNIEEEQTLVYKDLNNNNTLQATDDVLSKRDDRNSWNAGVDLDVGPFGVGVAYVKDNLGVDGLDADRETWVVGADYTTGPFKLGASYYNQDQELDGFLGPDAGTLGTDRYTGGVVYTYGPGMSFRGSVSYITHDVPDSDDVDATSVLLGTQINF